MDTTRSAQGLWRNKVNFCFINNVRNEIQISSRTEERISEYNDKSDDAVSAVLNNTVLYNAMIHPLTRMVIKGAIWYQGMLLVLTKKTVLIMSLGENNAGHNRDKYNCTFPKMIHAWRSIWHNRTNSITEPNFPFGFVQVNDLL